MAGAANSRPDFNIPLYRVPAIESALSTYALTNWLVTKRGGRAAFGVDALSVKLTKLEKIKDEVNQKIRNIKKIIEGGSL